MKIGILTFHRAINYGALLQAFGLQEYLKSIGHEVYVLDYRPDYLIEPYRIFQWRNRPQNSLFSLIKWLIREIMVIPIRLKRKIVFQNFLKTRLNLLTLKDNCQFLDCIIFGSDQIWNPIITKGIDLVFLGKIQNIINVKKVSYAASVGSINYLSETDFSLLISSLKEFQAIGVREKTLTDVLSSHLQIPISTVVDPVLLVGKGVFKQFVHSISERHPYLLIFTLGREEFVVKKGYEIARKKNLKVIEIISSRESIGNLNIKQCLSPDTFLSYINYSQYVVTSSFHGTVFSLLFQKNFNVVSIDTHLGERINMLLNSLGLTDRIITKDSKSLIEPINYDIVNEKLNIYQRISRNFLQENI